MSFDKPISFQDALADAALWRNCDVVLLAGNGLSIAWDASRFGYQKLLEGVWSSLTPELQEMFEHFGTVNFERVMHGLEDAHSVSGTYGASNALLSRLRDAVSEARSALVNAVHLHHPDDPSEVTEAQFIASRRFLRPFRQVFTTNYDLLLYWVINSRLYMQERFQDAFTNRGPGTTLLWSEGRPQTTHYLHGALHLVRRDKDDLEKLQWTAGKPIMTHVQELLNAGSVPIIVSEGESRAKEELIRNIPYLASCFSALRQTSDPLFTFGFSFGDQDSHIRKAIVSSKCPELYVGLHGGGRK